MKLERSPGVPRVRLVDPAFVDAVVVLGENRLPRKVVPVRLLFGTDIEKLRIFRPSTGCEVVFFYPEKQPR